MKWFWELIPYLEPYPVWVKTLVSAWVLLTAVCVVALLVGRPPERIAAAATPADVVWLKINRVQIFDQRWLRAGVRVIAKVNGMDYVYPSVGGARWVQVGPDMSPGLFKLPRADAYTVIFSMFVNPDSNDQAELISQTPVVVRKDELPYSSTYPLYVLSFTPQGSSIAAQIFYDISSRPN